MKIALDAIFGPTNFRSEIVWRRTGAHGKAKRFGPVHDVILFFTKSDSYKWNKGAPQNYLVVVRLRRGCSGVPAMV